MLILLWLSFGARAAPLVPQHMIFQIHTYDEAEPQDWTGSLRKLAGLEHAWASRIMRFDHRTPLAGGSRNSALANIESYARSLNPDQRTHLDIVIDGHGYPGGFGASSHAWISHEEFAEKFVGFLQVAAERTLPINFSVRVFLNMCFAGGAVDAVLRQSRESASVELLFVAACAKNAGANRPVLRSALDQTTNLLRLGRTAGQSFCPGGCANDEFREVFTHSGMVGKSFDVADKTVRSGPPQTVSLRRPEPLPKHVPSAFARAYIATYLHWLQREPLSALDLAHFASLPDNPHLRAGVARLRTEDLTSEIREGLELLMLHASTDPVVDDIWFERLWNLLASRNPHVRQSAKKFTTFLSEAMAEDRVALPCGAWLESEPPF